MRSCDEDSLMRNIFDELNTEPSELEPIESDEPISNGQLLAGRFKGEFHRAKVMCASRLDGCRAYKVRLIDFGITTTIRFSDLRRLTGSSSQYAEIPSRVFVCRLAELQPSSLSSEKGVWTSDAICTFIELVEGLREEVCAQVTY